MQHVNYFLKVQKLGFTIVQIVCFKTDGRRNYNHVTDPFKLLFDHLKNSTVFHMFPWPREDTLCYTT